MNSILLRSKASTDPDASATIRVTPIDDDGNPVQVDGAPTWGVEYSQGDGFSIAVDPADPWLCTVTAAEFIPATSFGLVICSYDADRDGGEARIRTIPTAITVEPNEAIAELVVITGGVVA